MERLLYSLGLATVIGTAIYLATVFFALTGKVIPLWILGLLIATIFIGALIFDIVTSGEEPPPSSPTVEE